MYGTIVSTHYLTNALPSLLQVWFSFLEFSASLGLSAAAAVDTVNYVQCGHVKIAQALIFLIMFLLAVIARPHHRPRDQITDMILTMTQMIACVLMAAGFYSEKASGGLFDAAATFLHITTAFLLLKVAMDLSSEAYIFFTKRRITMQLDMFGESETKALDTSALETSVVDARPLIQNTERPENSSMVSLREEILSDAGTNHNLMASPSEGHVHNGSLATLSSPLHADGSTRQLHPRGRGGSRWSEEPSTTLSLPPATTATGSTLGVPTELTDATSEAPSTVAQSESVTNPSLRLDLERLPSQRRRMGPDGSPLAASRLMRPNLASPKSPLNRSVGSMSRRSAAGVGGGGSSTDLKELTSSTSITSPRLDRQQRRRVVSDVTEEVVTKV